MNGRSTLPTTTPTSHHNELIVLSLIGGGIFVILLSIIAGLFGWFESKVNAPLPNWAENVLVSIATASVLKLGDVLAALVTLATGRQVETLGAQLATSTPAKAPPSAPPPQNVQEAAEHVLEGAVEARDEVLGAAAAIPEPAFASYPAEEEEEVDENAAPLGKIG